MNERPRPYPTEAEYRREMSDRMRRMETRLTKFMEFMGFDTEVRRPQFHNGRLDIPSDATSLRDCLAALPPDWGGGPVRIMHRGVLLGVLTKPPQ